MGLHVSVYRWSLGDCTNGGISSKAKDLCLVNVSGPSEPDCNAPAAMLVRGNGPWRTAKIVPAERDGAGGWREARPDGAGWMMGGNYAATSDSRFGEAVRAITGDHFYGAIPVHDRQERSQQAMND